MTEYEIEWAMRSVESPIEAKFLKMTGPRLADGVLLVPQVDIDTVCGRFRLDFMVEHGGRRIAIECDGAEFHDAARDEWRDAVTLGDGKADKIYRFRGQDLHYHPEDCLFLLSTWEPALFSERHRYIIERLSSSDVPWWFDHPLNEQNDTFHVWYRPEGGKPPMGIAIVRRPFGYGADYLKKLYAYALSVRGTPLDATIAGYDKSLRRGAV